MKKESFEKMDESLMNDLKNIRERRVPPAILKGFSASVDARIREKHLAKQEASKPRASFVPVWAPVFAVLLLAVVLVNRPGVAPFFSPAMTTDSATFQLASADITDLADEIDTLVELGLWNDEDDTSLEALNDLNDLEFSAVGVESKNQIA